MPWIPPVVVLMCALGLLADGAWAQGAPRIRFTDRAPAGLVGDGPHVIRVWPDSCLAHRGPEFSARFSLLIGGEPVALESSHARAEFLPGGVRYSLALGETTAEVFHGGAPGLPYVLAVRIRGGGKPVVLRIEGNSEPAFGSLRAVPLEHRDGAWEGVVVGFVPAGGLDFDRAIERVEEPYRTGLVLQSPDSLIDRAVPFSRALLDLGFDGRMHVCEIFRWRDVWSRDLGSGLVPGAMAGGRFAAARATLDYDLARYAAAEPRGLKVTQDPSQGGTAEGVAWLTRAAWREFLLTGDRDFLRAAAATLRPWVDAWLERDADRTGLLVDVSEWMDHSRFFLFPDGARVLYSNVLFAELLGRFAAIESELGNTVGAQAYAEAASRFVHGVNSELWDESNGMYDNLSLWGRRDQRAASAENALAVLCGVAPEERARRAMQTIRDRCWRPAGSTTIYPPMSHVPEYIDHNYKMWPWWNAVEARARFRLADVDGARHLLQCCSATLEAEQCPGMMEELTSPDGVPEGGNAFLTAAGSYLDAIVGGMLGVDILAPGCTRLRVDPQVPSSWTEWRAEVPLPQGGLKITVEGGQLSIEVTDPRVREIEVPAGARVEGARAIPLPPLPWVVLDSVRVRASEPVPPPNPRRAVVLEDPVLPEFSGVRLPGDRMTLEALASLDRSTVEALIVAGNALPLHTPAGEDVPAALARFLDRGGALVFFGATMTDRGTMGEHGGVIEWYDRRPVVPYAPIQGWSLRLSPSGLQVAPEEEAGLRARWQDPTGGDDGWEPVDVPAPWEKPLGYDLDGWGWYRARFSLPEDARGLVIALDLGRVDDVDWTYVNGEFLGSTRDWQAARHYRIHPDDPAYATLSFGEGDNLIAVRVLDTGGGGGLFTDPPRVGPETADLEWMPIDPRSGEVADKPRRHGVVSWGPGGAFFNSWETSRGAFGFRVEGEEVEFQGAAAGLPRFSGPVHEAFTDFAVSRPWRFEPLAFTRTHRGLLFPDHGESYPCAARLVNQQTGGEIILIPASIAGGSTGPQLLGKLKLGLVER